MAGVQPKAARRPAVFGADLLIGAQRAFSLNTQPPSWQGSLTLNGPGAYPLLVQYTFDVADPSPYAVLELSTPLAIQTWDLNGVRVPVPLAGMTYATIRAIPVSMARPGANTLGGSWTVTLQAGQTYTTGATNVLAAVPVTQFAFLTGPVIGYTGTNFFTVACRTRMPARVKLLAAGQTWTSAVGTLHALQATGLVANTAYNYRLTAEYADPDGRTLAGAPTPAIDKTVNTLPAGDPLVIGLAGDGRANPPIWSQVTAKLLAGNVDLALNVGDVTITGTRDDLWDTECFPPGAAPFFAAVPNYAVLGNHDGNSPLFPKLFQLPGTAKKWTQQVGSVLIVGIDGADNWAAGGANALWLDNLLAASSAKFIFLVNHYPPYSSAKHGVEDAGGHPAETEARWSREVILPILEKYHATAMLVGHDHVYERHEPPGGVSVVISGGGGATLGTNVATAATQAPYSQVFAAVYQYCILTVNGNTCQMQVYNLQNNLIDSRQWTARGGGNTSRGTPIAWLQKNYPGATDFETLDGSDSDADGMLTWQEYIAGTEPTNFVSCFWVGAGQLPAGYVMRWPAVSGRIYAIESSTSLGAGFLPRVAGIAWPQASYTNPLTNRLIFYRLGVQKS